MPGPSLVLRVSIDPSLIPDGDVQGVLAALSAANISAELEELGEIMGAAQQQNFETQGATFGDPWAALAPSTLREKSRLGFPPDPMIRSHALEEATGATIAVDGDEVTAGIDLNAVPYASAHQPAALGGTNTGGGRLPTRILVAFSAEEEDALRQALEDYFESMTGGPVAGVSITIEEA